MMGERFIRLGVVLAVSLALLVAETGETTSFAGRAPTFLVPQELVQDADLVAIATVERVLRPRMAAPLTVVRGLELRVQYYLGEPHGQAVAEVGPRQAVGEHETGPEIMRVAVPLILQNDLYVMAARALVGRTVLVFLQEKGDGLYPVRLSNRTAVFPLLENPGGWLVEDLGPAEGRWILPQGAASLERYPHESPDVQMIAGIPVTAHTRTRFVHSRDWLAPNPAADTIMMPADWGWAWAAAGLTIALVVAWRRRGVTMDSTQGLRKGRAWEEGKNMA